MDDEPPRSRKLPDDISEGAIEMILVPGNHTVLGPPPPPLSEEDLFATTRLLYPEPEASEFAADLAEDLGRVGVIWSSDILLLSALRSDEQWERMREFLKLTPEEMKEEVEKVKRQIRYPPL